MFALSLAAMAAIPVLALDPATATGSDVVNGNGEKQSGYSSAQLDDLKEKLAGKTLTFENGTVTSVSRGFGGDLRVTMSFASDRSRGFFSSRFMVTAKVGDPAAARRAARLDEGARIARVTGKVERGGMFFTLADAELVVVK